MTTLLPELGRAGEHAPADGRTPEAPPAPPARPGVARRFVRGRPADPAWVRPALLTLLGLTVFAYLWALSDSGWANSFYAAAVQAGTKSWKAFFFGSSDASNFITVDKPPASLWVMELSARIFGFGSWSMLVPQALEGVGTVGLVYLTVRRWFTPGAALLAGAACALTPVAALMFRFNNPDALLVLLLTAAAYATVRALERASTRWLVLAMALVGTGFITKMLQAFLVLPAIGLVYLLAAPTDLRRRLWQLAGAGVALIVAAGWWVAAVQLTPAADRPYVGGSQDNSLLNLIFGYNGLGRLSGSESGSVGGRAGAAGSMWGPTGWNRLFLSSMGGQISWLLPAALVLLAACLWRARRAPRTDRPRAAFAYWGLVLVVTAATFSFAKGIIHPYYTVALAPAIAALVGMGAATLWRDRAQRSARAVLAVAVAMTAVWSFVLLDRTPTWWPMLRWAVLVAGLGAAVAIAALPRTRGLRSFAVGGVALAAAFGGMLAYSAETVVTPASGAIPSAGPAVAGGFGGPGGPAGGPAGGIAGRRPTGGPPAAGGFPPGGAHGGLPTGAAGGQPTGAPGGATGGLPVGASTGLGGGGATRRAGASSRVGGAGGFLQATTPGAALVRLLESDAASYKWVAATVDSNSAAGYQLATDDPVMAIGGFNGTDPAPTLGQFVQDVRAGDVHFFIASAGGLGGGGAGLGQTGTTASQISAYVKAHYKARTVDGVTIYDLTRGSA